MEQPNVVFVFADQWRVLATDYAGDPNVHTPHLDALAQDSVNFTQTVSGCPICAPYRASLMTGQYPVTHGVFLNDVGLRAGGSKLAEAFATAGHQKANIGKWHLDGHGRSAPVPASRCLGLQYWQALGRTHDYHRSAYYDGDARWTARGFSMTTRPIRIRCAIWFTIPPRRDSGVWTFAAQKKGRFLY